MAKLRTDCGGLVDPFAAYTGSLHTCGVGTQVTWWTRKPGQPARKNFGEIVAVDPWYARVRLAGVDGMIRVRTVARKRLTPIEDPIVQTPAQRRAR